MNKENFGCFYHQRSIVKMKDFLELYDTADQVIKYAKERKS